MVFKTEELKEPTGIFVVDVAPTGHAMLWDHRSKAWRYDPGLVARTLENDDSFDRWSKVDRATAERWTPQVTGGHPLPSEDWFRWVFEWRGDPPEPEDDDPELAKMAARIRAKRDAAREPGASDGDEAGSGDID